MEEIKILHEDLNNTLNLIESQKKEALTDYSMRRNIKWNLGVVSQYCQRLTELYNELEK